MPFDTPFACLEMKTPFGGGGGGFSPSSLFSGGEAGGYYDPSNLTSLWQDSARTTPVTADGDPVGAMDDLSGNGNHFIQATGAARPLYKTDGTIHWLQLDGVDDELATTFSFITGNATSHQFSAVKMTGAVASNDGYLTINTTVTANRKQRAMGFTNAVEAKMDARTVNVVVSGITAGNANVYEALFDSAGISARVNGGTRVDTANTGLITDNGGAVLGLGLTLNRPAHNQYGLVVIDREITTVERINLEAWLYGKSGL